MTGPAIGVIADDLTGAADVASLLAEAGSRVTVEFGDPPAAPGTEVDAVVIGLKTRTAPVEVAVERSLAAAARLEGYGVRQSYFKYCSTFDSTDVGNIGPVADALADRLGVHGVVICPAYPAQGRTVEDGELRVHGIPLAETSMAHHPLTPMTDSDVVRLLGRQTPHLVGSIPRTTISAGPAAVSGELKRLGRAGVRYVVVDAVDDRDIGVIAAAVASAPLVTGGAALAAALVDDAAGTGRPGAMPIDDGPTAVLAGSCSEATRTQVSDMLGWAPAYRLDPREVDRPDATAAAVIEWSARRLPAGPVLVYSSAAPDDVVAAQERMGRANAAGTIEAVFGAVAAGLVESGIRRLVVAGGDTAGAVIGALPPARYDVASSIVPGVPWLRSTGRPSLALALKSGNFGPPGFFRTAVGMAA